MVCFRLRYVGTFGRGHDRLSTIVADPIINAQYKSVLIQVVLTPIVKFLGYDPDRLPGKLIHQKIMGTYSVILKLGT